MEGKYLQYFGGERARCYMGLMMRARKGKETFYVSYIPPPIGVGERRVRLKSHVGWSSIAGEVSDGMWFLEKKLLSR